VARAHRRRRIEQFSLGYHPGLLTSLWGKTFGTAFIAVIGMSA
jgi:hypothetical protein